MKYKHLLLPLLLCCSAPAFATLTAGDLLKRCNDSNSENKDYNLGFCRAYAASFLDTYVLTHAVHKLPENTKLFCLPSDGITLQTAVDIINKYFEKQSQEDLKKSARVLLFKAFMQQYPCGSSSRPQQPNETKEI